MLEQIVVHNDSIYLYEADSDRIFKMEDKDINMLKHAILAYKEMNFNQSPFDHTRFIKRKK
jgi:hypothetical protein